MHDSNTMFDLFGLDEITSFPENLLFGQKRIAPQFRSMSNASDLIRGRNLTDVANDLISGKISPDIFEISYTKLPTGELVTLNNRGLAVLEMSGKKPELAIFVPYEDAKPALLSDIGKPGVIKGDTPPSSKIAVTKNKDGTGRVFDVEKGKGMINCH